jgi:hypothetical protein
VAVGAVLTKRESEGRKYVMKKKDERMHEEKRKAADIYISGRVKDRR